MAKKKQTYFDQFKAECEKWIDKFQVSDWNIAIINVPLDIENYADTVLDLESKSATIRFNSDNDEAHDLLKYYAKHEAVHILTGRLSSLAAERYCTATEMKEADEALVNVLCKIIKE